MISSMNFQDKLDHKQPIEQSDIHYYIIDCPEYRSESLSIEEYAKTFEMLITKAQSEVEARYSAEFKQWDGLENEADKIHYFLFGLIDPLRIDEQFKKQLQEAQATPNSRVNIAMIYEAKNVRAASEAILQLDKELGTNTIYQDNVITFGGHEYLTISSIDAADNMVCETFRVKYKTIRKTDKSSLMQLKEAREEVWGKVQAMQNIYTQHTLWHRSPYDGAFMFLTKHGWLTTATRTPKDTITKTDLSLILNFDEASETITYAGDRLPSSDLPEFLVLVDRNEQALAAEGEDTPVIKYMAHFHKNEITRNPKFMKYAVPFYRYGVPESGHRFADELLKASKATDGINIHGKGRGFIILEHGVVRLGVKLSHFEGFLKELGL